MEEISDDKSNSDPIDSVTKPNFGCDFDKITSDTSNSSRDMNDLHEENKPNTFKFEERAPDDKNDNNKLNVLFSRFLPEFLDRNKISIV